jgi:type I restriction enzyme S subunit
MKALPRANISKEFIFYLLQEPRLHSFVVSRSERTAGQSGVNLELLEKYPAYLPPRRLQNDFSRRVSRALAALEMKKSSEKQLNELFNALQHRAFEGHLYPLKPSNSAVCWPSPGCPK